MAPQSSRHPIFLPPARRSRLAKLARLRFEQLEGRIAPALFNVQSSVDLGAGQIDGRALVIGQVAPDDVLGPDKLFWTALQAERCEFDEQRLPLQPFASAQHVPAIEDPPLVLHDRVEKAMLLDVAA